MIGLSLTVVILINFFFFLLYPIFGVICYGSLDDYFMSGILTGAYGSGYDVHTYFVNSVYGYFLRPFYQLLPKIGWYYLFELVGTFASFTTYSYFIIRKLGNKIGLPVTLILLAALTPDFYFQLSFTQCATAYTAAGILLVAIGDIEKKKRFLLIGAFFLIAGSVMRWHGFLLGLPFLCVLLLLNFHTRKNVYRTTIIILCITVAVFWSLKKHDEYLFSQGDYKYYAEYQSPRSFFGDGAYYDIESTKDELQERETLITDFSFARSWIYYDTENLDISKLQSLITVAKRNSFTPNWIKMPVAFLSTLSRALTRPSGWCWVIFCMFLIVSPSRKANCFPWISLSIVAFSIGYLLLINRVVYHVETGIWLYAIVSCIPLLDENSIEQNQFVRNRRKELPYIMGGLAFLFAVISVSSQPLKTQWKFIETREMNEDWKSFVDFAEVHADDVFLLSTERYKELGKIKDKPYRSTEPGSWKNIFPLGYWNVNLPAMKRELAKRCVENPIKDIIKPNVYVVNDYPYPVFIDFYEQHYHKAISVDTAYTFGSLHVLKYFYEGGL